jgi:hypothetical protein
MESSKRKLKHLTELASKLIEMVQFIMECEKIMNPKEKEYGWIIKQIKYKEYGRMD